MVFRYQRIQIYDYRFSACVFSPLFFPYKTPPFPLLYWKRERLGRLFDKLTAPALAGAVSQRVGKPDTLQKGDPSGTASPNRPVPPFWNPSRQNFAGNRVLVASLLAHNFPQNFPVGVAIVGAGPPTATDLNFFDSLTAPAKAGAVSICWNSCHTAKRALCAIKISGPHRNDAARCAMGSEEIQKKENYLLF